MIKIKLYQDKNAAIFYSIIAVLFIIILWLIAKPYFGVRYNYSIGDISGEDIVNPKDVTYVNVTETQKRIEEVKSRVPAIFDLNMSVTNEAVRKVDQFYDLIEDVNASMPSQEEKIAEVYNRDIGDFSEDVLVDTFQNFKEFQYRERVKGAVENILLAGLSLYNREKLLEYEENGIILKRIQEAEITQHKVEIDTVFAEDEIEEATVNYFSENFDDLDKKKIAFLVTQTGTYLTPNLFINEEESNLLSIEEVRKVEPIRNTIKKGAIVARRGEEINEDNLPKIQAIATYTNRFNLNAIIGIGILLLLLLYISVILFKGEEVKIDLKTYIVLAGFTLFTVGYSYLITLIKTRPN
jgi:membrane-associated HD superfamily phosphohydrolase